MVRRWNIWRKYKRGQISDGRPESLQSARLQNRLYTGQTLGKAREGGRGVSTTTTWHRTQDTEYRTQDTGQTVHRPKWARPGEGGVGGGGVVQQPHDTDGRWSNRCGAVWVVDKFFWYINDHCYNLCRWGIIWLEARSKWRAQAADFWGKSKSQKSKWGKSKSQKENKGLKVKVKE